MDNNKIGEFIASLRKEKGLTQQELGNKLFVTDKAVSKWERGLGFPDITILEKLADELDVEVSELLSGERGKKKRINIQVEIDKAIALIEENRKKKKESLKKKIKIICITLLSVLVIIFLALSIRYKCYHPSIIKKGSNNYEIGLFGISNLEKDGLDEFISIMSKTKETKNLSSNISGFNIELTKKGNIKRIGISINYFDDDYNYAGHGYYRYKDKNLEFDFERKEDCKTVSDCEINRKLDKEYSKSLNIQYISSQLKRIPFKQQIALSNLNYYGVSIKYNHKYNKNTNIFDMRDSKKVKALNWDDYKSGKGGNIEPGIYSVISFGDGISTLGDEVYEYVFDNVDGDIKRNGFTMETDYYISDKNNLYFTRDYGNNWINTDLDSTKIKETLNFYRDISLRNGSWFISPNELVPIAYFYGEIPKLKISNDNGMTWSEEIFDINEIVGEYKPITHRIVGFNDQNFGYVALGTDWTMGSGELKIAYLTKNSGKSWEKITMPEPGTSKTLMDFIMFDENHGVVFLKNNENQQFPYMYVTTNKGTTWKSVEYMNQIPDEVTYINSIDFIKRENDNFILTLGQSDSSTKKINLKSQDFENWKYDLTYTTSIHTVG